MVESASCTWNWYLKYDEEYDDDDCDDDDDDGDDDDGSQLGDIFVAGGKGRGEEEKT